MTTSWNWAEPNPDDVLTVDKIVESVQQLRKQLGPPPPTLHESIYATDLVQIRFPRSKKKRIRKKWAKDKRNFVRRPAAYLINLPGSVNGWPMDWSWGQDESLFGIPTQMIVAHPVLVAQAKERLSHDKDRSRRNNFNGPCM